jgi:hypothetical protein
MVESGRAGSEVAGELNSQGYRRRNGEPRKRHQVLAIARFDLYQSGKLKYVP